jgi:hypothetical protein
MARGQSSDVLQPYGGATVLWRADGTWTVSLILWKTWRPYVVESNVALFCSFAVAHSGAEQERDRNGCVSEAAASGHGYLYLMGSGSLLRSNNGGGGLWECNEYCDLVAGRPGSG